MKKIILFLITLPFLVSCSNNLSRSNAEKQILEKYKYPIDETMKIITYDNTYGKISTANDLNKYKKLGLLNYTQKRYSYNRSGPIKATLTEKGKKYFIKNDGSGSSSMERGVFVKKAELHFVEITGIKVDKEDNTATVEYKVKQTNFTPFGKAMLKDIDDKIMEKSSYFEKFDDGWRIKK